MKIRTQLVLACFLLSILPLSGIVLYSYRSSREALETAYQSEAARTTRQMDRRLAAIRTDLEERLAEVSAFPLQMPTAASGSDSHVASDVMMALGDTARLVDSLEIRPMEGMAPAAPHHAAKKPVAPLAPLPPAAGAAKAEGMAEASAAVQTAAAATAAVAPMIIDIPEMSRPWPSMAMSADQQNRLHELGHIAGALANGAATMSDEQRASLNRQMEGLQKAFNSDMELSRARISETLNTSLEVAEARRKADLAKRLSSADAAAEDRNARDARRHER